MKHILFIFLLLGCSSIPEKTVSEADLRNELVEMTSTLENLTYVIHKPIYGDSLD